jgi:hypothetical protein
MFGWWAVSRIEERSPFNESTRDRQESGIGAE